MFINKKQMLLMADERMSNNNYDYINNVLIVKPFIVLESVNKHLEEILEKLPTPTVQKDREMTIKGGIYCEDEKISLGFMFVEEEKYEDVAYHNFISLESIGFEISYKEIDEEIQSLLQNKIREFEDKIQILKGL